MNRDRQTAARSVDLEYDPANDRMEIIYNPGNAGSSRTRLEVQPWTGAHEFLVDESVAAGCDRWLIRVRVEWDAGAAPTGKPPPMRIQYSLEDFDCRNLLNGHGH